jgi:hypothetical protein
VTHAEETPDAPAGQGLLTVGSSSPGDVLSGRYRLEEHINDDARGRQVWRGIDIVLRRPVAIVLRHPGGQSAEEMLNAAVASSRITHPHLVDVYDAIDEGDRAYVVREWVDGASLRELVAEGPLDSGRATAVAHAVASAVAAAHETDMVHGNVQPGTVLFADDGRVVLADARSDGVATQEDDVRAIGAILYCALTGHWPHEEAGPDRLPDAVRNADGTLASPRQVRGGLPSYLSEMATDLLDRAVEAPTAESVATELGRLNADNEELFGDSGPFSFTTGAQFADAEPRRRGGGRKIAIGVIALLAISAATLIIAAKLTGSPNAQSPPTPGVTTTPTATGNQPPVNTGQPIAMNLDPSKVRVVDPPRGNRAHQEMDDAGNAVDGDNSTAWTTQWYTRPAFGGLKPGMGILIDLGTATHVVNVQVNFNAPGATVEALVGNADPGATSKGDGQIVSTYHRIGDKQVAGSTSVLPVDTTTRYVLVFVTSLPPSIDGHPGRYEIGINEITVYRTQD